jgi:23S rRNA pseudouridine1911/1915/1917 synthase
MTQHFLPDDSIDLEDVADIAAETALKTQSFTVESLVHAARLDVFLAHAMTDYSRSKIAQWIEKGNVSVDQIVASKSKQSLKLGQQVVVSIEPNPETLAYLPEALDLNVVYQDKDLFVINKPAGLVVHPAAGNWNGTLLNGLLHLDSKLSEVPRAGIVHRLDKDTSGLMVVARHVISQTDLVRQLATRTVKREYLALVWGAMSAPVWVDQPIGRDPRDRLKMTVLHDGKPAKTRFQPLVAWKTAHQQVVTLVKCTLETGRTHQIRVHAKHLKRPIVNDPLYGDMRLDTLHQLANNRQFLHAFRLGLHHPNNKEWMSWSAKPPQDLQDLLTQLHIEYDLSAATQTQ